MNSLLQRIREWYGGLNRRGKVGVWVGVVIAAFVLLGAFSEDPEDTEQASGSQQEQPEQERQQEPREEAERQQAERVEEPEPGYNVLSEDQVEVGPAGDTAPVLTVGIPASGESETKALMDSVREDYSSEDLVLVKVEAGEPSGTQDRGSCALVNGNVGELLVGELDPNNLPPELQDGEGYPYPGMSMAVGDAEIDQYVCYGSITS